MDNTTVQPGYKSTEFYVTLISEVVGILSMTGVVAPGQGDHLTQALTAIIGGVITIVPAVIYIYQRTWLKSQAMTATNKVTTTVTTPPAAQETTTVSTPAAQ